MRHVYAHRVTLVLAFLLIAGAATFGWMRSQGIMLISRQEMRALVQKEAGQQIGESLFGNECRFCHAQLTHIPQLLEASGGRNYLMVFMLFGARGEAVIGGTAKRLSHPAFDGLSDEQLAGVLNHLLVSWGNRSRLPQKFELYQAQEIKKARQPPRSPQDVLKLRPPTQ